MRAVEACEAAPKFMQDRNLRVDFAPPARISTPNPPHYKLYIRGFNGDEAALRAVFQDHDANIVKVHISMFSSVLFHIMSLMQARFPTVKDPQTGESRNVGFVDFVDVSCATEAKNALDGTEIAFGTKIQVEYARKKPMGEESRGGFSRSRARSFSRNDWGNSARGSGYTEGRTSYRGHGDRYGGSREGGSGVP